MNPDFGRSVSEHYGALQHLARDCQLPVLPQMLRAFLELGYRGLAVEKGVASPAALSNA